MINPCKNYVQDYVFKWFKRNNQESMMYACFRFPQTLTNFVASGGGRAQPITDILY